MNKTILEHLDDALYAMDFNEYDDATEHLEWAEAGFYDLCDLEDGDRLALKLVRDTMELVKKGYYAAADTLAELAKITYDQGVNYTPNTDEIEQRAEEEIDRIEAQKDVCERAENAALMMKQQRIQNELALKIVKEVGKAIA